eukprot:TRINITY_DN16685_c0_g1_i1.p1 TRINITY_DN16685_c0_g1~~TRINITY_DN16685_c0_g1_i1.p1  ORF type:complete len:327 (+),score=53.63 TRINITY_DN16685_c0_g1_i1:342-1322(+)
MEHYWPPSSSGTTSAVTGSGTATVPGGTPVMPYMPQHAAAAFNAFTAWTSPALAYYTPYGVPSPYFPSPLHSLPHSHSSQPSQQQHHASPGSFPIHYTQHSSQSSQNAQHPYSPHHTTEHDAGRPHWRSPRQQSTRTPRTHHRDSASLPLDAHPASSRCHHSTHHAPSHITHTTHNGHVAHNGTQSLNGHRNHSRNTPTSHNLVPRYDLEKDDSARDADAPTTPPRTPPQRHTSARTSKKEGTTSCETARDIAHSTPSAESKAGVTKIAMKATTVTTATTTTTTVAEATLETTRSPDPDAIPLLSSPKANHAGSKQQLQPNTKARV